MLYFWTDLAETWLIGRFLDADSESEMILHIRSQYQAYIGHFLQFCFRKRNSTAFASIQDIGKSYAGCPKKKLPTFKFE